MKKIATVSVLAIMAVSAARADIASTTYVNKAAAGAVETGLGAEGNITKAIEAATDDMATQNWVENEANAAQATADSAGNVITETYALKTKVGEVDLETTTYMKNASDLTAAVKKLDTQLSNVAGGNLAIKQESITATEIKDGAVGTAELANGSVTEVKLNEAVINKYVDTDELTEALQPYANNTAGYQTASDVSTAISTATASGVIKTALDGKVDDSEIVGMAKKSDIGEGTLTVTIDGANAGTFNANAAENGTIAITVPATYVNETELTTALQPYANNTAGYQTASDVSTAISTATTAADGVIKTALDGKVDNATLDNYYTSAQMDTTLAGYYTESETNTLLNTKLDDTAAGSATLPIYIDENGVSKTITSYEGKAATAGTADNYNTTSGAIKEKFDGVDTSLEKVAAFGDVPEVPAECVAGTADCTLVIGYTAETGMTHTWEKIAR